MSLFAGLSLPEGYEENTLFLLVQSPRVLYVYWELSPGQRAAIAEKGRLTLRLSIVNGGPYRSYDIDPMWNSFYFNGVEPGREYYCEIGVVSGHGEFYSLINSNSVFTPPERPSTRIDHAGGSSFWGAGGFPPWEGIWEGVSSEAFCKK